MDLTKAFTKSFEQLQKNIFLIIPTLLLYLFIFLLLLLFFSVTGLYSLVYDIVQADAEYSAMQREALSQQFAPTQQESYIDIFHYFRYLRGSEEPSEEYDQLLLEHGVTSDRIAEMVSLQNLISLLLFVGVLVFGLFYFWCMRDAMVSLLLKQKQIAFSKVLKETHHVLARYTLLAILCLLFFFLCLILLIASFLPFIFLLTLYPESGILLLFFFFFILLMLFGFVFLTFYVGTRFIFITPLLFLEDNTVWFSICNSYQLTKRSWKYAFFIFGILMATYSITKGISGPPLVDLFAKILFGNNILIAALLGLFVLLFLLIHSFVAAFVSLFLFNSFIDYKKTFYKPEVKK